ncbi:hypothetical protein CR513_31003, partial [Mucuna pruriens]
MSHSLSLLPFILYLPLLHLHYRLKFCLYLNFLLYRHIWRNRAPSRNVPAELQSPACLAEPKSPLYELRPSRLIPARSSLLAQPKSSWPDESVSSSRLHSTCQLYFH